MTETEAVQFLAKQVEKLTAEMLAMKHFVAAIPGARETHHQTIRNVLNRSKYPGQPPAEREVVDTAHRVIDELDGLSGEYLSLRKSD